VPWSWLALFLALHTATSPEPRGWRLRYIDLHITVDPAAQRLDGTARLTLARAPDAGDLVLDLGDSMTVDSARVSPPGRATPIEGLRRPGHLAFTISSPVAGAGYEAFVWYHGRPPKRAVGFDSTTRRRAASYGLPNSAREWWPSLDGPGQKADSADIRITAPESLVAVSNGRQSGRTTAHEKGFATTHWSVRHPIYPDVVSFAVGDYTVTRTDLTLAGDHRTPLELYAFPEDSGKVAVDLAPIPGILAFLEQRLGPYPFADEKYALVEFTRPSFREGQTLSHVGAALFTGTHENEQVFAHEAAHQWFGNALTVERWQDIWLNESLSEYMAWQWIRKTRGEAAYQLLLDSAVVAPAPKPIVPADPADFSSLFGAATFQRGPAVLVLLEQQIGTVVFQRALHAYVAGHAGGTVTTADFQRALEQASGKSLDAFFARWIRGTAVLPRVPAGPALGQSHGAVTGVN
jgi:aminopeptidase N